MSYDILYLLYFNVITSYIMLSYKINQNDKERINLLNVNFSYLL